MPYPHHATAYEATAMTSRGDVSTAPDAGMKEAKRTVAGCSRTNAGKTAQSRWYYKQKPKRKDEEKAVLEKNMVVFLGTLVRNQSLH